MGVRWLITSSFQKQKPSAKHCNEGGCVAEFIAKDMFPVAVVEDHGLGI